MDPEFRVYQSSSLLPVHGRAYAIVAAGRSPDGGVRSEAFVWFLDGAKDRFGQRFRCYPRDFEGLLNVDEAFIFGQALSWARAQIDHRLIQGVASAAHIPPIELGEVEPSVHLHLWVRDRCEPVYAWILQNTKSNKLDEHLRRLLGVRPLFAEDIPI
jgi:hypothetical protein